MDLVPPFGETIPLVKIDGGGTGAETIKIGLMKLQQQMKNLAESKNNQFKCWAINNNYSSSQQLWQG